MGEAVIKQALANMIPNSLFIEVHKEVMACLMCEAVQLKQEKKSHMVMVDLCSKLQVEKCSEHGDEHPHLNKVQMMHEDLALNGSIHHSVAPPNGLECGHGVFI